MALRKSTTASRLLRELVVTLEQYSLDDEAAEIVSRAKECLKGYSSHDGPGHPVTPIEIINLIRQSAGSLRNIASQVGRVSPETVRKYRKKEQ